MRRSSRAQEQPAQHEATLSVSFELGVDEPEHRPHFQECLRNGEKKRVFDSPAPEHHFHLQYQLLPTGHGGSGAGDEGGRGEVSKSDVVTFGVVSKVYTEKDTRVVKCWEEDAEGERQGDGEKEEESKGGGGTENEEEMDKKVKTRLHFGWRHNHSFKVNRDLLLQLYDHTLEVRLWNTKERQAPRARFDHPRAFRLPVEETGGRPDEFPLVGQQTGRMPRRRRAKKISSNLSSLSEGDSDIDLNTSISEIPHSPVKPVAESLDQIPEADQLPSHTDHSVPMTTTNDNSDAVVVDQTQPSVTAGEEELHATAGSPETTAVAQLYCITPTATAIQDISRSKARQLEAAAAERARQEREGVAVLRLKMADLFAKRDSIITKMDAPIDNIRAFAVGVSLESPLMPDSLRRDLNPTVFNINHASSLPTQHLDEQRLRCDPVYIKYRFHTLPEHCTPGHAHSRDITWDDSHVILLGTINHELLTEYFRGPRLVMEVHDRDRHLERERRETLFGGEQRDELLGTQAFGAGGKVSEMVRCRARPWDPFGVARFNLVDLLNGHQMMQLTTPITAGPRAPPSREDCRIGPHGRELPPPLPPGDYVDSQSYLTISIELSHPLPSPTLTPHTLPTGTSPQAPPTTTCLFNRLVYVTSTDASGQILIHRILDLVNGSNTVALGLEELPRDVLTTTLSTYKLTRSQMEGEECDVVTGFQTRDSEVSLLVVEGLRHGTIPRMWAQLPRHPSQDPGLLKVFYNSGYGFSSRVYGHLDVDLPLIFLPHSLTTLTKLPLLYIRGVVTPAALRGLLCLSEIVGSGGRRGMADLVRNDLFPSVEEISALAMQFGTLPSDLGEEEGVTCSSPVPPPVGEGGEGVRGGRRERVRMKVLLDMENCNYEKLLDDKKRKAPVDYIIKNIALTRTLSEQSAANLRRHKTRRSRSQTDSTTVHLYSSQMLNSAVLAKARMRAELGADHTHQLYTYCQDYHSMTFEPVDVQNERRAQRTLLHGPVIEGLADRQKWRTSEGFVYPGVPRLSESNAAHPHCLHPGRVEELNEPFKDGLLHANTMQPTVNRLHFGWGRRSEDFNRYYRFPREFGPTLPISIHLAGRRRAAEVDHLERLATTEWQRKVVVNDSHFYTHRRGVSTELYGAERASKLEDILKDPPVKYSLRQEGLRLEPIPPLDVIQNQDRGCGRETGESERGGVYQLGPNEKGSLKRDANVVPFSYQRTPTHTSEGGRELHAHDFRLFYRAHSPVSRQAVPPLPSSSSPPTPPAIQSRLTT